MHNTNLTTVDVKMLKFTQLRGEEGLEYDCLSRVRSSDFILIVQIFYSSKEHWGTFYEPLAIFSNIQCSYTFYALVFVWVA